MYNPTIGRWMTRDPIAEDGGVNLYEYCGNDPINKTDPSGLTPYTTKRTTESVQAIVGRPVTGVYDTLTSKAVAAFQTALAKKGYLKAEDVDGKWGNKTDDAYVRYRLCQALKARAAELLAEVVSDQDVVLELGKIYFEAGGDFEAAEAFRNAGSFNLNNVFGATVHPPDLFKMADMAWADVEEEAKERIEAAGGFTETAVVLKFGATTAFFVAAYNKYLLSVALSTWIIPKPINATSLPRPGLAPFAYAAVYAAFAVFADHRHQERMKNLMAIAELYVEADLRRRVHQAEMFAVNRILSEKFPAEDLKQ